jgi:hypothetical protein
VTAVAVLAVGGTVALRTDDGASAAAAAAAAAAATASQAASSPTPTPGRRFPQPLERTDDNAEQPQPGSGPNAGKVAMTGHAALAALAKALPSDGRTSGYYGSSHMFEATSRDRERVDVLAGMHYDDGSGPATVQLWIEGNLGAHLRADSNPGYDDYFNCDVPTKRGQFRYCSSSVLPDGSRLILLERATGDDLSREALLLRPDQAMVTVEARNTAEVAGQKEFQRVRDGLPLSLDQLKAAAMATSLQEWITPAEAQQAEQVIRPFHDDTAEHFLPSGTATPKPGATR